MANREQHCVRFYQPENPTMTSCTDSDVFTAKSNFELLKVLLQIEILSEYITRHILQISSFDGNEAVITEDITSLPNNFIHE